MTIPLPRTMSFVGCRHPEGIKWKTCFFPSTIIVCPAFAPPLALATTAKCPARRSTIFPFPSSPHCAPITAVTCPRLLRSFFTRVRVADFRYLFYDFPHAAYATGVFAHRSDADRGDHQHPHVGGAYGDL